MKAWVSLQGAAGSALVLAPVLAVVLVGAAGCAPAGARAGGHAVNPDTGSGPRDVDPEGRDTGENIDTYKKRLEELRDERATKSAAVDPSFPVCEDLCELMSSICQVKAKLCTLADEHPGEDNYQALCREAQHECRDAQDSCVSCTEASQQRKPEP